MVLILLWRGYFDETAIKLYKKIAGSGYRA